MNPKKTDLQIARSVTKELKSKLKDNLISVVFYGSRAEGKAHKDSDLDLFVLVREKPEYGSPEDDKIVETTVDYLNKKNVFVSTVVYDLKTYNKLKNLTYLKEVNKGIKL